jgi:hypothetical protein
VKKKRLNDPREKKVLSCSCKVHKLEMVRTGKIEQSQDTTPPTTTMATYLPKFNTQLLHLFPLTQLKYLIEISYMRELNNHTIVKPSSTRKNANHKKQAHQFWCKQ